MRTERFRIPVASSGSKRETYSPNINGRILGVMVSQKHKNNVDVLISLQSNSSGKQLIDPMSISHLADRDVEWGKNYFPLNLSNQKIDVYTQYIGEEDPYSNNIDLIFVFEDESNVC